MLAPRKDCCLRVLWSRNWCAWISRPLQIPSFSLLTSLAEAAVSRQGRAWTSSRAGCTRNNCTFIRHHYPSAPYHLYPREETMPGQEQQFQWIICQFGAGGKGWRKKSPERRLQTEMDGGGWVIRKWSVNPQTGADKSNSARWTGAK